MRKRLGSITTAARGLRRAVPEPCIIVENGCQRGGCSDERLYGDAKGSTLGRPPVLSPQPDQPVAAFIQRDDLSSDVVRDVLGPGNSGHDRMDRLDDQPADRPFLLEPKGYDAVNDATHEYKEEVKVGYNLRRKAVLLSIWALCPLPLYFQPTFFGMIRPWESGWEFFHQLGMCWLFIGVAGVILRSVQLCFMRDLQTGLAWAVKILTDPLHDIKLYYKAPFRLMHGEFDDRMVLGH